MQQKKFHISLKYHSPQLTLIVFEIFEMFKSKFKYPVDAYFWSLFLSEHLDLLYFRKTLDKIFRAEANFHLLVLLHFSQASRKKIRKELLAEQRGSGASDNEPWAGLRLGGP